MNEYDYPAVAHHLDRLADVPYEALWSVVTADGLCFWTYDRSAIPEFTGEVDADKALAEHLCAGCPVQDQCLELELRDSGEDTVGVWGAMAEQDRRRLYPHWHARRTEYRVGKWRHPNRRMWGGGDSS